MVSQINRPPPSVRIRDNQRRSRARRKEYIDDLEQRIRRFERQGVEATTEVQAAARKVAKENAWLRTLLVAHGVANNEIDNYLRGKHNNPDAIPSPPKAPMLASKAATRSNISIDSIKEHRLRAPCSAGNSCCGQQSSVPIVLSKGNVTKNQVPSPVAEIIARPPGPPKSTSGTLSSEIGAQIDYKVLQVALPRSAQNIGKPPEASSVGAIGQPNLPLVAEMPNSQNLTDDESTCEAAANIIASMRGHGDTETVMAELGCSSNRSCTVKNMTIFELLEG